MRVEVNRHTLQEIARDYEIAVSWVAAAGFPVGRGRLNDYRRIISDLSENFEEEGWGDLGDDYHRQRVCTALLEVRELVSIYRGLTNLLVDATKGLNHYIKGPFSPTMEAAHNASNRPRNIGFELYLNALFAFANLRPLYGSKADLSFSYMNHTFFVEAKRPTNPKAAESLIRDANKQLSQRLKDFRSHNARGFIALDLTKVINPKSKVMPVFSEEHLHDLMYNEDERQIAALRTHWHNGRHNQTVGVLLHYRLLTNFVKSGSLNTLKWVGFVQFADDPILDGIRDRIERAIPLVC